MATRVPVVGDPHEVSDPRSSTRDSGSRRAWLGRVLALVIVVAIFGKTLPDLVDMREVGEILRDRVGPGELVLPALLTIASVLVSAAGLTAGLPGLRLGAATAINIVTTAVSYALPAGGAAGAALNVTMTKELGFPGRPIALQMVVTGAWNLVVRIILPLLALGALALASDVPSEVRGAGVLGLVAAVALIALAGVLLFWDRAAEALVTAWSRLTGPLARRLRRGRPASRGDGAAFQAEARSLLRSRWLPLTATTLGYHLAVFGVLYASLLAAGVSRVGVLEAFAVYSIARQVTAIPLTPGGAGVLELALVGGLGLTGADLPAATAGVLLFRFFTYFLYLPTGGALWAWWRWGRPVLAKRPRTVTFRDPVDGVRFVAGLLALALLTAVSRGVPSWDADLLRLLNGLPDAIEVPVWVVMQAGSLTAVYVAALAAVLLRRFRLSAGLAVAGWISWILAKVVKEVAGRPRPAALLDDVTLRSDAVPWGTGFVAGHTAVAAALVTVAGAYLPRPYRRALWLLVAVVGAARMYIGAHLTLDVVGGAALGWAIGAAVLFAFGSPPNRPGRDAVRTALARRGVTATGVREVAGDLRRAAPFAATTASGRLFVKVLGRDQRNADLLHRVGRLGRRRPGEPPFATAKNQAEHEGYVLLRAARAGARVPGLRFLTEAAPGDWALVMDFVTGRPPTASAGLPDASLDEMWRQLALLRKARIAHRDLRPANILMDGEGRPWFVGWGAAESDTTPRSLDEDAARLLTTVAGLAGPDRAIASAARVLGPAATHAAARRLPQDSGEPRRAAGRGYPEESGSSPVAAVRRRRPALAALTPFPPRTPASARHPSDVLRVLIGLGLCLSLAVFAAGGFLLRPEAALFRLVNDLPAWLFEPVNLVMQLGALSAVALTAGAALAARRLRLATDLALGGTAAWLLAKVVKDIADRGRPGALLSEVVLRDAHPGGLGFVSGHAAVAAALATVASAHVRRPVRWALWTVAVAVGLGRIYVGAHFPLDVVAGAALGWAIGGTIHLVRGTPSHIPTPAQVATGLARCGLRHARVAPLKTDARGSVPFTATAADGRPVFVKALGRDQRDADLLFKAARWLLYRQVEDEAPMPSPKRQVEHEAYMLLRASAAGARVPALIGVAPGGGGTWLLAEEAVPDAGDLGGPARDRLDGPALRALWEEVAKLRAAGIAHRDLRLANVLIDADGRPVLVDFGFAEDAASDRRLAQDVAELLVSTALVVGPRRAVQSAADVLGTAALTTASAFLQPLALARSTRMSLRERSGLLARVRDAITEAGGTCAEPPPLSRAPSRPWLLLLAIVAGYALIGVTGFRDPVDVLAGARPRWLAVAALLVAASYAARPVALMGASLRHLAWGRTLLHQLSASYAARRHRANQDTIMTGYLRSHGAGAEEVAATVTLTWLTGAAVHATALVLALTAATLEGWNSLRAPAWSPLVVLPALAILMIGLAPLWKRRAEVARPLRAAARALPARLRGPGRSAALVFGGAAATSCQVLAFLAVAYAVGTPLSPATLAAVHLLVASLRPLGPLPGGAGVVEPVLVLALVTLGTGPTEAVVTVLAFQLLAFWLPLLAGAAIHLRRHRANGTMA